MVSLHSLLLNVAYNFRISAPDSQQLSQDLSQNHSISCPNIGPLILTSHQDERFFNYKVKAACLLNGPLHRHCIVMETVFRLFCIRSSMFPASSHQARPSTHAQHPFCSFLSERSLFRGHYSAPDLVLSEVLLSGVDVSNCWHETFSGRLRASQNVASQHVFCAFS